MDSVWLGTRNANWSRALQKIQYIANEATDGACNNLGRHATL